MPVLQCCPQSVVELMKEREEKRAAEEAKIAEARRAAVLRRLENAAQELLNGAIGGKQVCICVRTWSRPEHPLDSTTPPTGPEY